MLDHFVAILITPIVFVLGWAMFYDLFYNKSFVDNNYGPLGGIIILGIALGCIYFPCHMAYSAFKAGILGAVFKDFLFVGFWVAIASLFIYFVLKNIHKFVKKFSS